MSIEKDVYIREYFEDITGSKYVVEAVILLYKNNGNYYTIHEIWEGIKNKIDTPGLTPEQTCGTEIRKYTINSPQKLKVPKSLFIITNMGAEGESQKYQLIEDIRKEIDNFLDFNIKKEVWICPNDSCVHKKIIINRNNGIIDTGTWREIILHFLQHLKSSITYFGPSTFEKFLENTLEVLLSEEDKGVYEYETAKEEFWKNRIRTALGQLNNEEYITTDNTSDDITFKKHFRSRRRTEKFLQEFELYNDWEDIQFWICPKNSCSKKKILITRNDENFIDQSTYKKIIIHFLQHLKKNNKYFNSAEIYEIFLKNVFENTLREEDKSPMPSRPADPRCAIGDDGESIRTFLNSFTKSGYTNDDYYLTIGTNFYIKRISI